MFNVSNNKKPGVQEREESNFDSDNQENYFEQILENDDNNITNDNYIFNIIILTSGNIAISRKEAVEIYNLRKLDFSLKNCFNDNTLIQSLCLLQRINLVKSSVVRYVLELGDKTLLCATIAKIFRVRLTNDDSNHEIISYIKLENDDIPTKLILLGNSILTILIENKINCKIKKYKNVENDNHEQEISHKDKVIFDKENENIMSIYQICIIIMMYQL